MNPSLVNGARSEADILSRAGLPVKLGEAEFRLRPLTMLQAEKWEGEFNRLASENFAKIAGADGWDAIVAFLRQSVDLQLDLLYAYDRLGAVAENLPSALPARTRIKDLASRKDLWDALETVLRHEFPFVSATAGMVGPMLPEALRGRIAQAILAMAQSAPPSNSSFTSIPPTATRKRSGRS